MLFTGNHHRIADKKNSINFMMVTGHFVYAAQKVRIRFYQCNFKSPVLTNVKRLKLVKGNNSLIYHLAYLG